VVNASYLSDNEGNIVLPGHIPDPFIKKLEHIHFILQQFKMFKYDNRVKIPSGYDLKIEEYLNDLEKFNNNYRYRTPIQKLIEIKSHNTAFLKQLINENQEFKNLIGENIKDDKKDSINEIRNINSESGYVYIFPTV
jgi:hypothetical protein